MIKVREKNELITVNAGENLSKLMGRNFVKPKKHSILLPYFDELEIETDKNFQTILDGLVTSIITEAEAEASEYCDMFIRFIRQFGFRMSKETFLNLIRFFYEAIVKEDQPADIIKISCDVSYILLDSEFLLHDFSWRDLTLDWRPMYSFFMRSKDGKLNPNPYDWLLKIGTYFTVFYDPSEQSAIWETLLQELTIGNLSSMETFTTLRLSFLTNNGKTAEEVKKYAVDSWMKELWQLYLNADMNTTWTLFCLDVIANVCEMTPEAADFSHYYDVIFTKTIRSLNLKTREGKVMVGCGQEHLTSSTLAKLCAYTIGGPNSSLPHFKRLIQYIYFNVHPANGGGHTEYISSFIQNFLEYFKSRIKKERLSMKKRKVPKEFYVTDKEMDEVAETITDTAVMLMFSEHVPNDGKIFKNLALLNRDVVGPKLLDHLYSAITAVSEPSRMTTLIETFYKVTFEIIRQTDGEYRTPRDVVFDSTWLIKLEEMRKQWPTYELGSEVHEIHKHKFKSLRAHAFYIMEIFVKSIDVNDVDRIELIFKTLITLFSSFPLMDFSSAIQYHEMSDDDKILCLLSKRIPHLIEVTFKKILEIISCLSTCPPKSSGGVADISTSYSNFSTEGEEELTLKEGVSNCISIIFERVGESIRVRLYDILFAFLKSNEFANDLSTQLLSETIRAATWSSPREYKRFAEIVQKNLRDLITPEVQKSEKVSSCILFHVLLAHAVYGAHHDLILENEEILTEISDLLVNCREKTIHNIGMRGIHTIFAVLISINTEAAASPDNLKFARPLNEWNPVLEWCKCIHYKDLVIRWYIPAKPQIECVQRIVNRYFFPVIEKAQQPGVERDQLRQHISLLHGFLVDMHCLEPPENLIPIHDIYTPFQLPPPSSSLGDCCRLDFVLKGPNGENVREMLVSMVEKVMKMTNDPVSLGILSKIVNRCSGRRFNSYIDYDIEDSLSSGLKLLIDGTYCSVVKASQHTMDELAFFKHLHIASYNKRAANQPNDFDQRIIECLTELAMNDYEVVRKESLVCLESNFDVVYRCRDVVIPKVVQTLTDQTSNNTDRLTGAINLLASCGLLGTRNPKVRIIIWDAVLRIKQMDDTNITDLYEWICNSIRDNPKIPIKKKGTKETFHERSKRVFEAAAPFMNKKEPFMSEESIEKQIKVWQDFEDSRRVLRRQLVDNIFSLYIYNKDLHHTRQKLARSMVYNLQREGADERTMELLISQLLDEDYEQRDEARSWIIYLMWKSKPKTIRKKIQPPKRVDHGVSMESGVREDNLCVVYDSKKLPDTEEKWNEMIFVSRDKGACRWPDTLDVVRPWKEGPPLENKQLTSVDRLIIEFFSDVRNVDEFFKYREIEMDESSRPCESVYKIIKYVIRNYPNEVKPFEHFLNWLKNLLKSKEKKKQRLAAEIFLGVSMGLKHRPFLELDAFWKDITLRVDHFFDIMLGEAEGAWESAIRGVLKRQTDIRRCFWLVEALFIGAKKSTITETQQAFRLMSLVMRRWRCTEIMNQLSEIAWSKLPLTITEQLRRAVATVLRSATHLTEVNGNATFINVDVRFRTESMEQTIEKFLHWIPQMNRNQTAKSSTTDSKNVTLSVRETRKRRRTMSPSAFDQKMANLFLRTLLEYVLQYYETATRSWTPPLVKMLPKFMEYANEDDKELSDNTFLDVDITQSASTLIHDYMSGSWLVEQFRDGIIEAAESSYRMNNNKWRVRQAAIKFIMASVYSNIFTMCVDSKRNLVQRLLFEAVYDENLLVRNEVQRCLLLFIHCEYIHISSEDVERFSFILLSPNEPEWRVHGASVALSAIVTAFPFSLPPEILKPLKALNSYRGGRGMIKNSITASLREFRRQHREDWTKTTQFIGRELTYDIENATAPAYYA